MTSTDQKSLAKSGFIPWAVLAGWWLLFAIATAEAIGSAIFQLWLHASIWTIAALVVCPPFFRRTMGWIPAATGVHVPEAVSPHAIHRAGCRLLSDNQSRNSKLKLRSYLSSQSLHDLTLIKH